MRAPGPSQLLDEELYSRQLYVLGPPAMQRMREAKVLLSGLQGLGAEVAKNLVLMGVGSLTLHDPCPTCWSDLAAQFLLSERDLGRSRAEASRELLAQLNEAVQVSVHLGDITEAFLLDFQVVVLTASKLEEQLKVGAWCHEHGVCFLVADSRGLVGQLFCDFGENFTVQDPTEAEPLTATIQHISQGCPGILTLRRETVPHSFRDGHLVTFSGIEGMVELNGCDPQPIRVQGFSNVWDPDARCDGAWEPLGSAAIFTRLGLPPEDGSLEIGDTATFSRYLRGGTVIEVKRAKTVNHKPLETALLQPQVMASSSQHRVHCLHQAFRALHKFQDLHGRPPQPWDPVDAEAVVCLARALGPLKGTDEEPLEEPLDEALVRITALSSAGSLSPMAALLGAVAAQEVLKAISGKFMPLDQWLYFDALDCLPENGDILPKPEDCVPRGCRYDGQIAVFGAGFQEKLSRQHYLLVGAGAIGCELLKGFALVGLGAGGGGSVTVADMDHVERSNLSRQFLFRPQDIGRPKAEVAAVAAQRLNPDLQVTPLTYPLDPTTEHVYGDHFFSRVNGVAAALDSFQARHYVAARCTHYLKPLLEAGTEGTKGSAAVFVPDVTEGYKASGLAEDTSYPVCTVRHFPSTAEHTLQWARDEFEGLFRLSAETINRARQAHTSLADMDGPQTLALLRPVLGVLKARPQNWEDCVVWAHGHWQLRFHYGIIQLLSHIPPDRVLEDGTLFWSGLKQCPQPLEFDMDQENHLLFVLAAANLYARMHGLPGSLGLAALKGLLLKSLPQTDPQRLAPILTRAPERDQASAEFGPELLKELQEVLGVWSEHPALNPLMFEKDDDSNFHMDFVVAAANLRSQNYGIPPVTRAQGKQIVGRIIPAIATTTAAVAGLVGLELYKVVGGSRTLGAYRHSYLHLAENRLLRWVPSAPATQMFQSLEWTCWYRLKVSAGQPEKSLQWLLAHLQEQHGLRVRMLLHGTALLYSASWSPAKQAQFLPLSVTELVQQVTGRAHEPGLRVLVLELSCEGEEEDTAFPPLHYEL